MLVYVISPLYMIPLGGVFFAWVKCAFHIKLFLIGLYYLPADEVLY